MHYLSVDLCNSLIFASILITIRRRRDNGNKYKLLGQNNILFVDSGLVLEYSINTFLQTIADVLSVGSQQKGGFWNHLWKQSFQCWFKSCIK